MNRDAQNGHWRVIDGVFRQASEEQMRQSFALVGAHDNQVDLIGGSELEDSCFFVERVRAHEGAYFFQSTCFG